MVHKLVRTINYGSQDSHFTLKFVQYSDHLTMCEFFIDDQFYWCCNSLSWKSIKSFIEAIGFMEE